MKRLLTFVVPMSLTLGPLFSQDWSLWETAAANPHHAESHALDDGRILVLHVDEIALGSPATRVLLLQSFDGGAFTSQPIEYVGTADVNALDHAIRLAGNGRTCWAVWRTQNSAGDHSLRAVRVHPQTGPLVIETITTTTDSREFDLCLGSDGLPRVSWVSSDYLSVWMARRNPDGSWDQGIKLLTPPGTTILDTAIAARGAQLSLFACSGTNLSLTGAGTGFESKLYRYYGDESADWGTVNLPSSQTWDQASFATSNDPVAFDLRAKWTPDGRLAATYANFSTGEAVLAHWKAGILEVSGYHTGAGVYVRETGLACGPDGSIHVSYRASAGANYRTWKDGTFSSPVSPMEMDALSFVSLATDRRGYVWMSGCQPGTVPNPKVQVGTLRDNTDEDHDGFVYLLEDAFHTNPTVADFDGRPILEIREFGGQDYLTASYLGDSGGSGDNPWITADFAYHVEVSSNGVDWSGAASSVVLEDRYTIPGRGTASVVRSTHPVGSLAREFIRIRVVRR